MKPPVSNSPTVAPVAPIKGALGFVYSNSTPITVGTNKVVFRMPCDMTLTLVRASFTKAPTGSPFIIDINQDGTSILSTRLSVDAGEKTSKTAVISAVISVANLKDDAEISIDFDQVGSAFAGEDVKFWFIGTRN